MAIIPLLCMYVLKANFLLMHCTKNNDMKWYGNFNDRKWLYVSLLAQSRQCHMSEPLHFYVQYQNEKVNEPAATFPWTGSRGQKVILYYMIYHGLVTRHCPHTAVFRLRRVALSNNNLSRLPPILLAEAIVRLKDVDLRSSFLSAEQVMTGFANEKMIFDQSLDHSWTKNMTDLIRVCLTHKIKIQVTSLLALLLEPSSQLKRLRLVKI